MKDLGLNNFYNCQIIGDNADKKYFVVNIIGSTFTGKLLYNNLKNKNVKIGQIIILQLITMDKENKKYEFSGLNVDENFDKKIIINQLSEDMIKKSEENLEIYKNIQNIISEATKEKEMQELIDMNVQGDNQEGPEEIDYETLIQRKGKHFDSEEEEEEEENEEKDNEEEEDEKGNDLLEKDKNIIKNKEKIMKIMTKEKQENKEEEGENEEEEEESDEEENMEIEDEEKGEKEADKETKKKRILSKKKEQENLKKEIKIREIEQANLNNEIKNAQYYERLILKDHDNSINWIEYASYILDTLNLASARQIFERALKIIDIAKTKEKLNIWVAYLNLENVYGNKNTFEKIFERAKEVCDKKILYKHVIQIYLSTKKYEEVDELYKILIKDFFSDLDIWKNYIEFLFEVNNLENHEKIGNIIEPKEGLNKSMQVLSKKNQLDIMAYYGQLLYRYNNNEEARNMFDNILKNFPKRKDIWFVYIDKEIKYGKNWDKVRQIFDKMFEIKFKVNDLKSIMKKFLEFEKQNCKDEKEFLKAQEKTKEILEKRMAKKEEKNEEEENEEE
jgi:rRNA biogenesis protein RRP5